MTVEATPGRPDPTSYRAVVSRFATGVTVVATEHDGLRYGMTANSFTSVSLDPLLVLFCCEHDATLHAPVLAAGRWGVSVLAAGQEAASRWFATKATPGVDQFEGWPASRGPLTGMPLLDGSLATFECRTWATYDGGDHTIVVGEVLAAELGTDEAAAAAPLLWFRSSYRSLSTPPA